MRRSREDRTKVETRTEKKGEAPEGTRVHQHGIILDFAPRRLQSLLRALALLCPILVAVIGGVDVIFERILPERVVMRLLGRVERSTWSKKDSQLVSGIGSTPPNSRDIVR